MKTELRHYCRNPHCRMKLKAPVSSERKAFCTRGCHSSFYLKRCLVCEGYRANRGQLCHKPSCRSEYRRNRVLFDFDLPSKGGGGPIGQDGFENAQSIGLKSGWRMVSGPEVSPATLHCATVGAEEAVAAINRTNLRHWREYNAKAEARCLIRRADSPIEFSRLAGVQVPRKQTRILGLLTQLVIVFVLWLACAYPAVAMVTEFGFKAKPRFAPMATFVPISNPTDAVTDDSCSLAGGSVRHLPAGGDLCPQFLAAQDFIKGFDQRALNVERKPWSHENLSSDLDIFGCGFSDVECQYGGPNERFAANFSAHNLDSVDFDFRPMSSDELLPGEINTFVGQSRLTVGDANQKESEDANSNGGSGRDRAVVRLQKVYDAPEIISRNTKHRNPLIPWSFFLVQIAIPAVGWLAARDN